MPRLIFLSVSRAKKRSTWLSQEALVGVRCTCQRGLFGEPVADQRCLVRGVVVHDEMDVEIARDGRLDLVEELAELGGAMAAITLADDVTCGDVEGREQ